MNFQWQKYKRVFAFGCSFTRYVYPTWANIIFHETPQAKCYNFGKPGLGNVAISARIAEANIRYKFNENDLVLVMYTTFFREDRYIENQWQAHGCVYSQPYYDKSFVKKYVDPIGCMIRDFSVIELSKAYVTNLPCDSLLLKASDIKDEYDSIEEENPEKFKAVIKLYGDLWNSFPKSMKETLFPYGWETRSTKKINNKDNPDSHPITIDYYKYLTSLGVNLSEDTQQYVLEADSKLKLYDNYVDWVNYYPEVVATDSEAKVF